MKLAYITNDTKRKTTYKKRTKGLVKKVRELTTLCKIEACAIILSPDFDSQPESIRNNKMVNQESFLEQSIAKATLQLKKRLKENHQKDLKKFMFQSLGGKGILQSMNVMDLNEVGLLVEQNLQDIDKRIRVLTNESRS
ncbi:hypothetical protein Goshw_011309 [Gossypium schwendimanii]|uniref:MADS-box domain-containing protein n=1 Tax=Gossypium schwendimanii TaxID=34291 RepID=A0A7J9MSP4_GOSSC|nr:hypothetical protein [Gossypium schwendimanii]